MLISIASGVGLQNKIYEKVSAFNGDIIISNFDTNFSDDSQNPISINQEFYPIFNSVQGIKHILLRKDAGEGHKTPTRLAPQSDESPIWSIQRCRQAVFFRCRASRSKKCLLS